MNGKMIFMLLSILWYLIDEQIRNFKHYVYETWLRICGSIVFEFYKIQIWSESNEICRDVMISYGESVIKIIQGFAKVVTYDH